jgi:hypothetical protein
MRVAGGLNSQLERLFRSHIDQLVENLLLEAVKSWEKDGFSRFNDDEVNCAVRVLYYCLQVQDRKREYRLLTIAPEWYQFLPEMLEGSVSAGTASRPDMRISIGPTTARLVESKCLRSSGPLPRAYVNSGIDRFLSGKYLAEGSRAMMIGYVLDGSIPNVVAAVNGVIDGRSDLSSSDHLGGVRHMTGNYQLYVSNHTRTNKEVLGLTHHLTLLPAPLV